MQSVQEQAQEWIDAMIDNLNEADPATTTLGRAVVEEYLVASGLPRGVLNDTILANGGVVVFESPDDGQPTLTTGHRLQQMLQAGSVEDALRATHGRRLAP